MCFLKILFYYIKRIILVLWQLPQELLGFIIFLIANRDDRVRKLTVTASCYIYFTHKKKWSISLGDFVMIYENDTIYGLMHESGHKKQSKILGWFYLPLIGIPSFLSVCIDRTILKYILKWNDKQRDKWYYNLPWEKWANKLEGLDKILVF